MGSIFTVRETTELPSDMDDLTNGITDNVQSWGRYQKMLRYASVYHTFVTVLIGIVMFFILVVDKFSTYDISLDISIVLLVIGGPITSFLFIKTSESEYTYKLPEDKRYLYTTTYIWMYVYCVSMFIFFIIFQVYDGVALGQFIAVSTLFFQIVYGFLRFILVLTFILNIIFIITLIYMFKMVTVEPMRSGAHKSQTDVNISEYPNFMDKFGGQFVK
jgi:hypothetical protein